MPSESTIASFDFCIIGAGMVGLSQALLFAQTMPAARILVLESRALYQGEFSPSFDDRVTALSAATVKVLQQLGLWPSLAPALSAIDEVIVSDKGHFGATQLDKRQNSGAALGYTVNNKALGRALMDALSATENITLMAPVAVESCQFSTGAASLICAGGQVISCSLLLLADGANSALAQKLGISFNSHDYHQRALIANVLHSKAHNGCAFERFSERGPLALLPMPSFNGQHRSALVWTRKPEQAIALCEAEESVFLAALQQQFGWQLGHLKQVGLRQSYELKLIRANEQWRRRLVLIGNAAHFLHPVAGQGFNLALRDAEVLTQILAEPFTAGRDPGALTLLERYAKRRHVDQWLTTNLSHGFIRLFSSTMPLTQLARNTGLSLINHNNALKKLFSEQMMGTGQFTRGLF